MRTASCYGPPLAKARASSTDRAGSVKLQRVVPGAVYAWPRGDSLPSLPNMPTQSTSSFKAKLEFFLLFQEAFLGMLEPFCGFPLLSPC